MREICISILRNILQQEKEQGKQKLDRSKRDFNTLFSATDETSRHKMFILGMEHLNNIINNFDLIDIFRTLQPTMAECILFSSAHKHGS